MNDENRLHGVWILQLYVSVPMETDVDVIEKKICNMNDRDKVFYLNTFMESGRTIEDNTALTIQNVLNEKLDCVVTESTLVDVVKISKVESAFVVEFVLEVEYHFDESEAIEPNQAQADMENVLRKGCPSGWVID